RHRSLWRSLKYVSDHGEVDHDHQDRDHDRAEEKMQSAEARVEAEQKAQHGVTLFRRSWPQRAFRAVNRGTRLQKPVSERLTGSLKLALRARGCDNCCPSNRHYNSCHPLRERIMVQAAGAMGRRF